MFFKNSGTNTQLTIQTILQSSPDLSDESLIPPIGNITMVSNTSRTIDNTTAKELIYKSDLLMYGTTYFEKKGKTVIINYQAPINDFKNETANFDIIINSIKVQ